MNERAPLPPFSHEEPVGARLATSQDGPVDASPLPPARLREGSGVGARYRLGRPTVAVRDLRNNATPHEEMLWRQLQGKRLAGLKFSRQMPIAGYRVDFVCRAHKLIVELDGSQHAEAIAYDQARTLALEHAGYRVIRFWNNDLTSNMDGVLETIAAAALGIERAPTPYPLPLAGGEAALLASPDAGGEENLPAFEGSR